MDDKDLDCFLFGLAFIYVEFFLMVYGMWQVKLHYIVVGFTRLALPLDLTMWSHTVTLLGLLTLATLLSTASELHYKQPS